MLDTVGWVIWPVKIVPDMTYNVFGGTLNPTLLLLLGGMYPRSANQVAPVLSAIVMLLHSILLLTVNYTWFVSGLIVKAAQRFLRRVGLLLHSVPKIKHDGSGDQMVYPWYGEDPSGGRIVQLGNSSRAKRASEAAVAG